MAFDRNQTEFSSEYQRIIWQYGTHIMPPEVSLADVADARTREGCLQVFACTMEILEDMYCHPEEYSPEWPRWYTCEYLVWLGRGDNPIGSHRKSFLRYIEKIPQFGFVYDKDTKTLTNPRYPLFVEYICQLSKLAKERKQNLGGYLHRCDFRLFADRVNLTLDDLLRPLSDEHRGYFLELHEYALAKGLKVEKKSPYTFRYTCKKLYTLVLNNYPFRIGVPFHLNNGGYVPGPCERFLAIAECQPDNDRLVQYMQDHIDVCNACGGIKKANERCGHWVEIRGKRRLLASCRPEIGRTHGKVQKQYTREDVDVFKRMVDVRVEQVDGFVP